MKGRGFTRNASVTAAIVWALTGAGGTGILGLPLPGESPEGSQSIAAEGRMSPRLLGALDHLGSDATIPVIVTTAGPMDEADAEEARGAGATIHRRYERLDGYAATVPAGSLRRLAGLRNVSRVSYDLDVRTFNDLNYVTVGAYAAAQTSGVSGSDLNGNGVTIAVIDSGIANHPDIGSRQVAEVEIVGHEKGFADYFGHGTHVAGIIAGNGSQSSDTKSFRRFNGIAPQAKLVSVRVLDPDGNGRVSDVLAGIDWVISNKDTYRIRVLNLSLGHPVEESYRTDPLCRAVERAWAAGILVVAAAGNSGADGYATIHSPGNDPWVLTVGASNNYLTSLRADDLLTTYTSRGPSYLDHVVKPDLVAPGNRTISLRAVGSTLDRSHPELRVKQGIFRNDPINANNDSAYFQLSGSSMSAGVVSGMAALMIQANPSLTPDTLKARLMKSAEKRLEYDIFSEGAGFADLLPALSLTAVATAPALSPTATWTENGILIESTGELWQDSAVWGDAAIWGMDPLRGTGAVWGDAVVWGGGATVSGSGASRAAVAGNAIVWGGGLMANAIVWGGGVTPDAIVWGGGVTADAIVWGGGVAGDDLPPAP